jgi:hypothetical protein
VDNDFEVCWQCGTARDGTEDPAFEPEQEGIMGSDMFEADRAERLRENLVTVGTFWTAVEAHLLRARLEEAGIHATVMDEPASTMSWGLLNTKGGVKVVVPEKELEKALEQAQRFAAEDKRGPADAGPGAASSDAIRPAEDSVRDGGGGFFPEGL